MLSNIRILREEQGVSQRALAEAVGVSQQSINKYENHNIEPDISTLVRIADYFGVTVDFLVGHGDRDTVGLTVGEMDMLEKYRRLDRQTKDSIGVIIEKLGK